MSKVLKVPRRIARTADEEHWIPLSDLMTTLMFLFLLIALAYMLQVRQQSTQTFQVINDYRLRHDDLYAALDREFGPDLRKWNAELTPDLTVSFHKPEILFRTGSATLRPQFEKILQDFFPRYVRILDSAEFRGSVKELRIEGASSANWRLGASPQQAFVGNMALSQDRARAVLSYVMPLSNIQAHESWLMAHLSADGLSSSHPVRRNGKIDPSLSQRVDFRVVDPLWDRVAPSLGAKNDGEQASVGPDPSNTLMQKEMQSTGRYSIDSVVLPAGNSVLINGLAHPAVDVDRTQPISITGWATDQRSNVPASAVYIRTDGDRLIKANYGAIRDDVAFALRVPALNRVGFVINIPANTLAAGEHHFDFIVVNSREVKRFVVRDRLTLDAQ